MDSRQQSTQAIRTRSAEERLGFKSGDRGTHTSRTIMFAELKRLLSTLPPNATGSDLDRVVVDENVLSKRTASTRRLTLQRLSELYALDPAIPLFRHFRTLWPQHEKSQPLLAMLCALTRDPLLRATAESVLSLEPGAELPRRNLADALREITRDRLNDSILDKVVRNAASSWTQSGHLQGRMRKVRRKVSPTPPAATYALFLGFLQGFRGIRLLKTLWTRVLDAGPGELLQSAFDAKLQGLLDVKQSGEVLEVSFPGMLTREELELSRGSD